MGIFLWEEKKASRWLVEINCVKLINLKETEHNSQPEDGEKEKNCGLLCICDFTNQKNIQGRPSCMCPVLTNLVVQPCLLAVALW